MELKKQVQQQYYRWLQLHGDRELAHRTFLFNLQADKEEEQNYDEQLSQLLSQQILCLSKKLPLGKRILWILKAGPELK